MTRIFGTLLVTTLSVGTIAINTKAEAATTSANASVNVSSVCTLSGGTNYSDTIANGGTKTFGPNALTAVCNDPNGYGIYTIGYSGDTYGNNSMISNNGGPSIATNTTGDNSYWAMQLSATGATIENSFNNLHVVPNTYTKVASKPTVATGTTGESTINVSYRVSISSTQAAGEYTGKVKYLLLHPNSNLPSSIPFIQDLTLADCETNASAADYIVVDKRDGKQYTVRYLDGGCWMTQNLAIEPGTHMTAADTNITPDQYLAGQDYYTLPGEGYDLKIDGQTAGTDGSTGYCNGSTGYTNACSHVATNDDIQDIKDADTTSTLDYTNTYTTTNIGAWYNYAAATAGTIVTASTKDEDVYNICPYGWTLPSHAQNKALITALSVDNTVFSPLYGGHYKNGLHNSAATNGYWWSSTTTSAATARWTLRYKNDTLSTVALTLGLRYLGDYVRCVLASS